MAFVANQLRRIGDFAQPTDGIKNPGLFTYITADATATVTGASYFDAAADMLTEGAVIMVVSSFGGAEVVNLRVVTAVSASNVVAVT